MITWPIFRDETRHRSKARTQPWHRDEIAAARSISRWEDDGGSIHVSSYSADDRPITDGHALPAEARHF